MELYQYIFKNNITQKNLAKDLGVSPLTVHFIVRRKSSPSLKVALALEKLTKGKVSLEELLSESDLKDYSKRGWDEL